MTTRTIPHHSDEPTPRHPHRGLRVATDERLRELRPLYRCCFAAPTTPHRMRVYCLLLLLEIDEALGERLGSEEVGHAA